MIEKLLFLHHEGLQAEQVVASTAESSGLGKIIVIVVVIVLVILYFWSKKKNG
jgi:hypothetical protein